MTTRSERSETMFKKRKHPLANKLTAKGFALKTAIEVGLLPEAEENGEKGWDTRAFEKFWKEIAWRFDLDGIQ